MVISLRTCYMHSIVLSKVQRVIKIQTKGCNVDFQFWTITKYNLFYIHNFEYLGFRVNPRISNLRNLNLPFLSVLLVMYVWCFKKTHIKLVHCLLLYRQHEFRDIKLIFEKNIQNSSSV